MQIDGERAPWKPRPGADHLPLNFVERIAVRLPEHARPKAEQCYLAMLDRVLMDFRISTHAADDLVKPAESLELGRSVSGPLWPISRPPPRLPGRITSSPTRGGPTFTLWPGCCVFRTANLKASFVPPVRPAGDATPIEHVLTVSLAEFRLNIRDLGVDRGHVTFA